ncbi:MAG: glycosyltransferase [Patescibacteria group bacterium]
MKIAFLHPIYKPYTRGGAETVAQNIVEGLKRRGEDIFVISLGYEDKVDYVIPTPPLTGDGSQVSQNKDGIATSPSVPRNDKIKVYRLKSFNLFNFLDINKKPSWLRLPWHLIDMFNFIQSRKIEKILLQEKPDLVFMQGLKGLSYLLPRKIKQMKIKHLYRVFDMQLIHPTGLLFDRENIISGSLAKIYKWFCRWLFDSPQLVIFPSHYVKSIYESNGFFKNSAKEVWSNPVVIPSLKGASALAQRDRWESHGRKNTDGKLNLLFLGQIEEYKGIFKLMEALGGLDGDWTLNVVGDGKALSEAQKMALEAFPEGPKGFKIRFWGRLTQKELEEQIWPITDLLVNPSQVPETFGLVVAEAQAHCVPVLVSGRGALPELVREDETGWVVKNNDWREKIEWCLANQERLETMREKCLIEAQKYNLENYLNKLMKFGKMGE